MTLKIIPPILTLLIVSFGYVNVAEAGSVSVVVANPYQVCTRGETLVFNATITNNSSSTIILSTATDADNIGPEVHLVNEFASLISSPITLAPGESTGEIPFFKVVTNPSFGGPLPAEDNIDLRVLTQEGALINTVAKARVEISVISSSAPCLFTELSTNHAIALDSVTLTRDPFSVISELNFSADHHTRIALFVSGLTLEPDAKFSPVSVLVDDCPQDVCQLAVEYIAPLPELSGIAQVLVRLPDELMHAGNIKVSVNQHGETSNKALISVK